MIHNGIEYGLMQAYAEGFDILKNANIEALPPEHRFDLELADIAEVRRRGSVIPSWLLDLTASALAETRRSIIFRLCRGSGEGRWTVKAAIEEAVPAEVLTAALYARFRSRKEHTFAEKILSAMRTGFGGQEEPKKPGRKANSVTSGNGQTAQEAKPDPAPSSFRRDRRPHALGWSCRALQPRRQQPAAGQVLPGRCRPQGQSSDELRDSLMKGLREFATRPVDDVDRAAPA